MKTIAMGSDHWGVKYKAAIKAYLEEQGHKVLDQGPFDEGSVDYPDMIHPAMKKIGDGEADLGIILCGSGNGVAMTANKYSFIRAGLCWTSELAALTREHNNANVLAIPAGFVSERMALMMAKAFVDAEFEGGRHQRRVDKISC